jgi:hypothetical protein
MLFSRVSPFLLPCALSVLPLTLGSMLCSLPIIQIARALLLIAGFTSTLWGITLFAGPMM